MSSAESREKVAFLGLGRMGRILAGHLLDAGHHVTVWNRSTGAEGDLVSRGASSASTAAEAVAGAGVVFTALFGPPSVREVVLEGLDLAPETLWVDITTVAPADAEEFASWADERGVRYVHSPVIGSLGPAAKKALGVLVGGPAADRVVPYVSLWADPQRLQVLPTAAAAATGKLIANLALAVSYQGLVEAVRLGTSGGLDVEQVLTTLVGTGLGPIAAMKGDNLRTGDFSNTQFSTDLLLKDTMLMLRTTTRPLPALTAAAQALLVAQQTGHGDDDFSVVASLDLH
ncbi:MAG TPA: NAD(P)-dependent oxidoreductase [Propionibacteriaceae bacterium]|nr:NAD(P)-dependent oxidoreductase [Propionibacteriaceae bacterium]